MNTNDRDDLTSKRCLPCEGGVDKCTASEAIEKLGAVAGWRLTRNGMRIRKDWVMKNFSAGIDFFNKVSELAESEGHHPDLHLEGYRNVWIEIWTHALGGLSENDFILAAKIDLLPARTRQ